MKLLKFYGTYCAPCKVLTRAINELNFKEGFDIISHDVEKDWELADKFKIMNVPTCILVDDNDNEVKRWIGTFNPVVELKEFIQNG